MLNLDVPAEYRALAASLGLTQGINYTEHWSAGVDFLTLLTGYVLHEKPACILECSSGLSTLVLARCCQINGRGSVISLENGRQYAEATRHALAHYGLECLADVVDAPLVDVRLGDRVFQWYSLQSLPETAIDLLVIDGPPGFIQKHSRYPALPLLFTRMQPGTRVYLDDAARNDEREVVSAWLEQYPGLRHEYIGTGRGCSKLVLA